VVPPLLLVPKPPLLAVTPPLLEPTLPQEVEAVPLIDCVAPFSVQLMVQLPPLVSDVQTTPETASVPHRQSDSLSDPALSVTVQQAVSPVLVPEQPAARASAIGIPKMMDVSFMRKA
jgi:hypothetical protein